MAVNDYRFVSHWRVRGRIEDAFDTIWNVPRYVEWWSAVYLEIEPSGDGYRLLTRGWLPYKLRWHSQTTEAVRPHRIAVKATGDLNGTGIWIIAQDGDFVVLRFEWVVAAEKPLIRYLSFLLKPMFAANHRWAMARGEEGLRAEMARHG